MTTHTMPGVVRRASRASARATGVSVALLLATLPALAWQQPILTVGRTAPSVTPAFCDYQTGQIAEAQTQAALSWDNAAFTVSFRCAEPRMADLKAKLTHRDDPVWGEDSVEVFLRPPGDGPYFHFAVNALGTVFDERGQDSSWNSDAHAIAAREAGGWSCTLTIPWAAIGGPPKPGDSWTGNFARCRHALPQEQLSCWAVTGGSFHNTAAFGKLIFAQDAAGLREFTPGGLLPGLSTLHARLAGTQPLTVRLSATHPPRVLAESRLATADLTFDLTPDDLRAPLELAILDAAGKAVCLQAFASRAPIAPPLDELRATLARLQSAAAAPEEPAAAALRKVQQSGQDALADLDASLASVHRAKRPIEATRWAALVAALRDFRAASLAPVIWTAPAGALTSAPPVDAEPAAEIALPRNGRASVAVFLKAPLLAKSLPLGLALTDFHAPGAAGDEPRPYNSAGLPLHLSVSEAVPVPLRGGATIADPLSPLPASGLFRLDPDATRELWVSFDSHDIPAGYYTATLGFTPLHSQGGASTVTLPLHIRVWDLELPRVCPVATYVSDYTLSVTSPAHLQDLLAHHVNVLDANGLPSPDAQGHADFSKLGAYLRPVRGKGGLFLEVWFMRETGWRPQYARWIRDLCDEMVRQGYHYEDWILEIYDETLCDEFLECCRQIKAVEPKIRIFSDYMGTPERIKAFAPYVDLWCPFWADLNKQGGACLQAMRDTGKPIWTYDCGGTKTTPLGRYRALPWVAWRSHLDGVYCWCYPGSAWDETGLTDLNYGHVYEGWRGEPVPSRRWEAFSAGMEDLMLLRQYEAKLPTPRAPEDDRLLAAARALGEQAGGDPAKMEEMRARIAHRLLALEGRPLTRDFPRTAFPHWQTRIAGDGGGSADLQPGARTDPSDLALLVKNPTAESWTFTVRPLTAVPGQHVALSVWARGKGSLRVGVCEGFAFGGDPTGHRISDTSLPLSGDWQKITVKHEVQATPVEAFVGFDYGNAAAEAVLSDVLVEVAP